MAYRKVFASSNEVLKFWGASMHEEMVVEMPMKCHEKSVYNWMNESMNQEIDEPMKNERSSELMNQ